MIDHIPDTFSLWIDLTGSAFSCPTAGTVPQPLGATLTANPGRAAQDTLSALLAAENRNLDQIFEEQDNTRDPFFASTPLSFIGGGYFRRFFFRHKNSRFG